MGPVKDIFNTKEKEIKEKKIEKAINELSKHISCSSPNRGKFHLLPALYPLLFTPSQFQFKKKKKD